MKRLLFAVLLACALIGPGLARAGDVLLPVDSAKDLETRIGGLLKERLRISSDLTAVGDDPDDLRLQAAFKQNPETGVPAIILFVDTRRFKRDDGSFSQVISLVSLPNLTIQTGQETAALRWANSWNSRVFPVRAYVAGHNVVAAMNLVTSEQIPVTEDEVLSGVMSVLRAWVSMTPELRQAGIVR